MIFFLEAKVANLILLLSKNRTKTKTNTQLGLERWLHNEENLLFFSRTRVYLPVLTWQLTIVSKSSPGESNIQHCLIDIRAG